MKRSKYFGAELSDQEWDACQLLLSKMQEAKHNTADGKITMEVEVKNGGVTGKWIGTRFRVKS